MKSRIWRERPAILVQAGSPKRAMWYAKCGECYRERHAFTNRFLSGHTIVKIWLFAHLYITHGKGEHKQWL